jgi:hypothetical protein
MNEILTDRARNGKYMLQKLNRLRGMTTDEMRHRLRERIRCEVDRLRCMLPPAPDRELANLINRHGSLKSYLQHGPARRFYPSTQDREGTADFVARRYPESSSR